MRLPRRIVPICVSDPIGSARPFRMARTPAIVVVLTAPRPTSRMPSLPRAGAMSSGGVTIGHYIMRKCAGFCVSRASRREPLPITMSGVRMGERLLQIGVNDSRLAGVVAAKVGLSGHAAIAVADERAASRARDAAAEAGVLADIHVTPLHTLPFDTSGIRRDRHQQCRRTARLCRRGHALTPPPRMSPRAATGRARRRD